MSTENVETVRRLFRAGEERDLAGVLDAYDPEIVIHEADSLPCGGDHRGLKGARRHAYGFLRAYLARNLPAHVCSKAGRKLGRLACYPSHVRRRSEGER